MCDAYVYMWSWIQLKEKTLQIIFFHAHVTKSYKWRFIVCWISEKQQKNILIKHVFIEYGFLLHIKNEN